MQNNLNIEKFLSDLNIQDAYKVEEDLGDGFVRLKISEAERRQALQDINSVEDIIVELLRNSRDAESENIFVGTKKIEERNRNIYFIDDGKGIPPKLQKIIFESRVTSKLEDGRKDPYGFHGRGMALFSIKLNVDDIKIIFSDKNRGSAIFINIDIDKIPEKKDQSIMPQLIKADGDLNIIGGVNNIVKAIMEFQFHNKNINFYYGSPIQILASMRYLNKKNQDAQTFNDWDSLEGYINSSSVKVIEIPSLTNNYNVLKIISEKIFNMCISQRGIQRIIYEEIEPLKPLKIDFDFSDLKNDEEEFVRKEAKNGKKNSKWLNLYEESGLAYRFKDEEIKGIIEILKQNLNGLGKKYFIKSSEHVDFKKSDNSIKIEVRLEQKK